MYEKFGGPKHRPSIMANNQGCQMVCFQTKNPSLGKNFTASDWKMLIYLNGRLEYFMDICDIL
jgi:hypothetical protein